jgi:hypothetical protein
MGNVLTRSQVGFYRANGFCVVDGVFDNGVLDRARGIVDELLPSPGRAPAAPDRVLSELAEHSRLLDAVSQLIGEDIVLRRSELDVKPPRVGGAVDWHRDFAAHPHSNTDLVAAVVHLDETTGENACLRVAAGSHRISSSADVDESTVVDCEVRAGSVVFLHPLVAHSSERNLSDLHRRVFVTAYRAADALPLHHGPHAARGEPRAKLLRGKPSRTARGEAGVWPLPVAEAEAHAEKEPSPAG